MKKVAVVYWSGTGNTQMMAEAVAAGAKEKGAEAALVSPRHAALNMAADMFSSI